MANARDIVRQLTEGIDDPDLDNPEGFGLTGHLDSPVGTLAAKNGFTRLDRHEGEERWVKKLPRGREAWLRTRARSKYDEPETLDMQDPQRHGGRQWEFLEVYPVRMCAYCNNPVPKKTAKCPHCRKSAGVREYNDHRQLATGSEVTMSYLLGAILQRLATWPEHLPKPGQPGWKKAFESVMDVDDPDAMLPHLKAQEGCPHCGCPDYDVSLVHVTPEQYGGTKVYVHCQQCARSYAQGEEKTRIVPN